MTLSGTAAERGVVILKHARREFPKPVDPLRIYDKTNRKNLDATVDFLVEQGLVTRLPGRRETRVRAVTPPAGQRMSDWLGDCARVVKEPLGRWKHRQPEDSGQPHDFEEDESDEHGRCRWCGDDEPDWKHKTPTTGGPT